MDPGLVLLSIAEKSSFSGKSMAVVDESGIAVATAPAVPTSIVACDQAAERLRHRRGPPHREQRVRHQFFRGVNHYLFLAARAQVAAQFSHMADVRARRTPRFAARMRTHTRVTAMQSTHPHPNITAHKITSTHNHYECSDCDLICCCTREL